MIKGLAITPPILGRISIGKVVEKNGKRLPEKDDQFTITSQIQNMKSYDFAKTAIVGLPLLRESVDRGWFFCAFGKNGYFMHI